MSGSLRRLSTRVLALFVAMLVVTGIAPWMEAHAWERVCSAQGDRWVDADGHVASHDGSGPVQDHAAHCPLCLPAATPPVPFAWIPPVDAPVATRVERLHAVHLASLVGAPFPPRAPPVSA